MRTKFKAWAEPYLNEHPEVMLTKDDLINRRDYYLEIGSGKGKFLADMAKKFANESFIGIERNVTCCGFAAKRLVEEEITNGKLIFDNADAILLNIPENSLNGIFLNFSDPWPKKRHAKRRLTAEKYLSTYFIKLKPQSKLIIKTDNVDLFNFSKEMIENSSFKIISIDEDYDGLEEFDVQTEYELSFRSKGNKIHRIVLMKA